MIREYYKSSKIFFAKNSKMSICQTNACDNGSCMHCQFNLVTGQQACIVTFKDMEQLLIEEITRKYL